LAAICAAVLSAILVAGLWPFHAPKNEVSWASYGNGLLLGNYGSLLSAREFSTNNATGGASLEVWLEPRLMGGWGTILSFYAPEHCSTSFALRQSWDDLALLRLNLWTKRSTKMTRIYAGHVFRHGVPVFLTITSSERGTSVYVDGVLVMTSQDFRFSTADLSGQLVVGNASATTDTWSGQLKGLAIYARELTASQVVQNYQSWVRSGEPFVSTADGVTASYFFNERRGNVVHNRADSATDLVIPERFFVFHEPFLERPWNEYYPGWPYWKDIGVNIAGFIPLGFFFYAFFSMVRRVKHPAALTIAFGFMVSLTIEVLQAYLPTRNSGMTDLITNTFGTILGVFVCARCAKHYWFVRALSIAGRKEDLQLVQSLWIRAWHSVQRVIRFSSESIPDWLRNCLWCTSRWDMVPHDWHLQLSRQSTWRRSWS
jgi:hypothetical protein